MSNSKTRLVEVIHHNPDWPAQFEAEKLLLQRALPDIIIAIHHIGSTSVPGLAAKPIIDILMEVRAIAELDDAGKIFTGLGYEAKGEFGIPGRRFFIKGGDNRTHHLHAFRTGDPHVARHIAFRDWLIAHPEDARAYAKLKTALAAQHPHDVEAYMAGKDGFIKALERKASRIDRL